MKLTKEQIAAFIGCKSPEDIMGKGKELGLEINTEDAKRYFESLGFVELDEDAVNVAGGACTTTLACDMCGCDISHSPYYQYRYNGRFYCCTCAKNSGMVGNNYYEYHEND